MTDAREPGVPVACVVFLGCPKNQVDSERVLGSLTEAGYTLTTEPRSADLIVITTCAFLQSAVRESEAAIEEALRLKQGNAQTQNGHVEPRIDKDRRTDVSEKTICAHPCSSVVSRSGSPTVVVAGCLVERYGKGLKRKFSDVDSWVSLADMPRLAQFVASNHKPQTRHGAALNRRSTSKGLSEETPRLRSGRQPRLSSSICNDSPRVLSTPKHFAYLKIADGCDNRCSYCMIPDIRGPFQSRPMPDVLREAEALARSGVKELILVAQDTTLYGTDIYSKPSLTHLLEGLGKVEGIRWLRLMYTHPAHITEDLIDQLASNPKLCRYIDLPIQHVSDHLLDKMNRHHNRKDVELLLHDLRAITDVHIRTTIIVGLPGETKRDFDELLAFIRQARFDRLSCYAYSPEPGTKAARMPGQVSPAVKKERVRRLMLTQAAISRTNLKKLVGRRLTVLVDALGIGRTQWDAPEIDGVVKLTGRKARPGSFVRALVTGSSTHDLTARALQGGRL